MSIWATLAGTALGLVIGGPLGALAGAAAGGAVDAMRARATNPERRRVAFSIAAIALAAKMASADGNASAAEFATFQRLFHVDPAEAGNARRFYDLAKGSMAGFQAYAIDEAAQARIRRRHLAPAADDPWAVLGVEPGADAAALRAAYHALVKRYHPDRALAEGVPSEFIRVSELRMADINAAYDRLTGRRR
jgi:DnaJ like chaperone protein